MMLAWTTNVNDFRGVTDEAKTIAETRSFTPPDKHLIKVTACWRSMESRDALPDKPSAIVTLSIADHENNHMQEQNHRIDTPGTGQAGGEMSRVLKVLAQGGDITPTPRSFRLRAQRVAGSGTITVQAKPEYPTEIRVEDLGPIPPQ